jgi:POT family proton-dependent oligopeptide transporter
MLTIAELHFSPIGISLVSNMASNQSRSTVMGIWFTTTFLGNIAAGWIGSFWSTLPNAGFFLLIAALGVAAACSIRLARPILRTLLGVE